MKKQTLIVGLTGQTGAGKSIVSRMLTEREYRVIDCDAVARDVVKKGKKCLLDLSIAFGIEILNADGSLNRRKLGNMVFGDSEKQKQLNRITFPYIQEEIFAMIERLKRSGEPVVFLDAPTLIESGTHKSCDKVVSVLAPADERFLRIVRRDGLTTEEAERRMSAQHDDGFYTRESDFVIVNDGDMTALVVKVLEMLDAIGVQTGDGTAGLSR
ncbi:dephospho-CoA kinase [Ruminococcaceae bacterium OttesenSCG-928-L11]|nr:dephospho-CoA kinase [Ruminococcaceae bacterium OttesenSCG-928-L11]